MTSILEAAWSPQSFVGDHVTASQTQPTSPKPSPQRSRVLALLIISSRSNMRSPWPPARPPTPIRRPRCPPRNDNPSSPGIPSPRHVHPHWVEPHLVSATSVDIPSAPQATEGRNNNPRQFNHRNAHCRGRYRKASEHQAERGASQRKVLQARGRGLGARVSLQRQKRDRHKIIHGRVIFIRSQ